MTVVARPPKIGLRIRRCPQSNSKRRRCGSWMSEVSGNCSAKHSVAGSLSESHSHLPANSHNARIKAAASKQCWAYTNEFRFRTGDFEGTRAGTKFLNRFKTTTFEVLGKLREMGHNIGLAEIFLLTAPGWVARSVSPNPPGYVGSPACGPGAR